MRTFRVLFPAAVLFVLSVVSPWNSRQDFAQNSLRRPSSDSSLTAPCLIDANQVANEVEAFFKTVNGEDITKLYTLFVPSRSQLSDDAKACSNIMCIFTEQFGDLDRAKRMIYLSLKHSINPTPFGSEKETTNWKVDELDDIIQAVEALPGGVLHLQDYRPIHKLAKQRRNEWANSTMEVLPLWSGAPRDARQTSIYHELGHIVAKNTNGLDSDPKWLRLGSWAKKDPNDPISEYTIASSTAYFVSAYARTNPFEDFAETFREYRYHGSSLKAYAPEKYAFMKNYVFDGLEYLSDATCNSKSPRVSPIIQDELTKKWKLKLTQPTFFTNQEVDFIFNDCATIVMDALEDRFQSGTTFEPLHRCALRAWAKRETVSGYDINDLLQNHSVMSDSNWPRIDDAEIDLKTFKDVLTGAITEGVLKSVVNITNNPKTDLGFAYLNFTQLSRKLTYSRYSEALGKSFNEDATTSKGDFLKSLVRDYLSWCKYKKVVPESVSNEVKVQEWIKYRFRF